MKKLTFLFTLFCIVLSNSCIKPEPDYREADIESFIIDSQYFITSSISENKIQVIVSEDADYTKLISIMKLSPGAAVEPKSGSIIDFSNNQIVEFTVTAEDGIHQKKYTVSVSPKIILRFGFEEWIDDESYPKLADLMWSSANSGLAILSFKDYPTNKTTDCVEGNYAVQMKTMEGMKNLLVDIPLFSGSLFWGEFRTNMSEPLKSTRLGHPHPKEYGIPIFFNGYYKYTAGPVFTDKNRVPKPELTDSLSMRAVLFKVTKGISPKEEYLDGETINNSDRIVGNAEWKFNKRDLTDTPAEKGFTKFSIPFDYTEKIDFNKYDYRLTIVFSSSKDGDLYEGAVGSVLIVDDVEIICEAIADNQ